jgi:hypothetical protein
MQAMAEVGILAVATALAAGGAFLMAWAFLQGAVRLMQPAGATRSEVRSAVAGRRPKSRLELVQGTRSAARAFAKS